jgi:serralysin
MSRVIRACVDRWVVPNRETTERLALMKDLRWEAGSTLHASFMDGDARVQEKVALVAQEWMRHANLKLLFSTNPTAQIRISFQPGGSWSYIGTECLGIPKDKPTMNLGWLRPDTADDEYSRVVLHEFGHALGCIHEHRSPAGGIQWNEKEVLAYYAGPPNHWDEATTRHNILETYNRSMTASSEFDPESIMIYPILKEFTLNGFEVGWNRGLSDRDKAFIREMYPED